MFHFLLFNYPIAVVMMGFVEKHKEYKLQIVISKEGDKWALLLLRSFYLLTIHKPFLCIAIGLCCIISVSIEIIILFYMIYIIT